MLRRGTVSRTPRKPELLLFACTVTPSKLDRRWLAILVLSFVAGLGVSWQRWTNPVIDSGRLLIRTDKHLYCVGKK